MAKRNPDMTRKRLLDAAMHEILTHGFQAASIDRILKGAELTKGAFYHHFPNKLELGYALVSEKIGHYVDQRWIQPLSQSTDFVTDFNAILERIGQEIDEDQICHGCPLNNLAQEMSAIDDTFRLRLAQLFERWRGAMRQAIERSQSAGRLNRRYNADDLAFFILALLEGSVGVVKTTRQLSDLSAVGLQLKYYLQSLQEEGIETHGR